MACLMLFGALSAGIPNVSAITGNETISGSALTNSSATLSLGYLDTSDSYYWWVWISDSSGTVTDFDYGSISPSSSSMTIQSSWTTPSTSGNYTVDAELTDSNLTVLASVVVGTFYIGGGGGGSGGNVSQNDAGSGGDAGDNATAAYNLTVTSGSTYAGYVDQTDINDWYRIFVPTGKGITASMSFNGATNGTNDLDLYLIDSLVTTVIDSSFYSNPEVVNSSGTNVSGQYVYLVVEAYTGFSYYNITISFFNIGGGGTGGSGQNDAGSGGDAGDNATAAYNLTVTSGSTYAGYVNQTDLQDWYLIYVPSGKGITASMTYNGVTNGTNDLDLYLIDYNVTTYIDYSWYSNPEVVNSSGTNVSGQYVYLLVEAFSGFSYYNFTVTFYNVGGSSGGITADQYEINDDVGNATSATLPFTSNSLTIHNSTDWDVFAINMTSGMTYWMNATFTHSVGDLDIYITDSSLNLMSYSETMTDDEATSWTANATGTFYAIVLGYMGATNTYGLSLEGGASNVTGDVSV
ncbi:MAG: hypothetical protein QF831_03060, partial [Candidatus Thalassarchaeaceae archaeon]|nr:hypothetical protein [Candidatus Thalassarchaeaceae archaeon]